MIEWQHRIRDVFSYIGFHIRETIRTQNNAISRVLAVWNTGNRYPLLLMEGFPAPCAPESPPIHFALPVLGIANSSPIETHYKSHKLSPIYEWRKVCDRDWWYYTENKWTGIMVSKELWIEVYKARQPVDILRLKHPVFCITHHVKNDAYKIDCDIHIIDMPTYKQAIKMAELYYSKWEAVNSNGTVSDFVIIWQAQGKPYPLTPSPNLREIK